MGIFQRPSMQRSTSPKREAQSVRYLQSSGSAWFDVLSALVILTFWCVGHEKVRTFIFAPSGLAWRRVDFQFGLYRRRSMKRILIILLLFLPGGPSVFAQSVKSGYIKTSDGVRIHYLESGRGQAIVFIPGWMMPAWIWQKQIDELSKKYRVIAVDPRSQGESDKPNYGHLPETRARDYKQLVDQLGLKQPVLVGWSMGVGELLSYVEQFGDHGIAGLILVDGLIPAKDNPPVVSVLAQWTELLQQHREKEADVFVHAMYKKPQPDDYIQRLKQATLQVPTDTAVALIYNMISVTDFSKAFAGIDRPVIYAYEPVLQPNADFIKSQLGDKVRLERYDDAGHALFVDDPETFNHMVDDFVQSLPKQQE